MSTTHGLVGAGQPFRVSPPIVVTDDLLARCGGLPPVWADPLALADETEADRVRERRLYVGLAAAIAVVVALWVVRSMLLG
ncbi:hypothetical protein [Blastococcus sp. TF02A-35]|uniref:hypothetical protein n=1 Tax=Blastococcus sp. TF02A-35 TaxID=2559612 RepID=UPI00107496C3|nr:hypothetical protein [Blastococcus sp. TF02A_35]TFV52739.1 hypothetical protein E4P43_05455 [Blastococcus sp. TF02A_35]